MHVTALHLKTANIKNIPPMKNFNLFGDLFLLKKQTKDFNNVILNEKCPCKIHLFFKNNY